MMAAELLCAYSASSGSKLRLPEAGNLWHVWWSLLGNVGWIRIVLGACVWAFGVCVWVFGCVGHSGSHGLLELLSAF